ncbi:HIT domain-containing protein [Candidatus Magnetaquicoccus inordinatus]|uniref:HIT domain-containing protein n=1 Tax=Candidatus Magnetaquicoccus inordinatus TaxID=2496818 RepID=UPI001D0E50B8|nr:HIT family protein [Candidatus Magnetaquicoccus inordinatus]
MAEVPLHPRLQEDTFFVKRLSACQLLLMNDSRYPWLILVPNQRDVSEWDQLSRLLWPGVHDDICRASQVLRTLFKPDKLNIAALGNLVPQLHIHVLARFRGDAAWPKPVWGALPPLPYALTESDSLLAQLRTELTCS